MAEHRLVRAAKRQPVDRAPVWIMRQAGRYLPEFREVRAKADFLTVCRTPELAIEVSLQPLRRMPLDAAIIFSDILVPVEAMGQEVRFLEAKGPVLPDAVRTRADVDRLRVPVAAEAMGFVGEAISGLARELAGKAPVIGFCGSPWTLAAYMIEGGGSRNYGHIKAMMYEAPEVFDALCDKLVATLADHLRFQLASGADVVQVFDSWGGALSRADYRRFALPALKRLIAEVKREGKPVILYCLGGHHLLDDLADCGADVLSLDWRCDLGEAFDRYGDRLALQGNLDPCMLYASPERIEREVQALVRMVGDRPGHIFNLGHGILPDIPVEHAQAFVEAVHRHATYPRAAVAARS